MTTFIKQNKKTRFIKFMKTSKAGEIRGTRLEC